MKHEHDESQHMKTSQHLQPALVITSQATKARHPRERALHHPSAGQQDEAAFGLGQANHLQAYTLSFGCQGRSLARVALIDKGQFDMLSGHVLHRCGQLAHLIAILFVSRRHVQGQQRSQRIHRQMDLAATASFGSVVARSMAAFGTRLQRATIKNGRRGLRSCANRKSTRKSSTIASKTPALSHRWVCWYTAAHGGKSCGIMRHCAPVRTSQRKPLNTSRRGCSRCGASSVIKVRYGATNAH